MEARSALLPPGSENEDEEGRRCTVLNMPTQNVQIEALNLVLRVRFRPHSAGDNVQKPTQSR
jgi:hypothetical protein